MKIDSSLQAFNVTATRIGAPSRRTASSTAPAPAASVPADDRLTLSADAEATAGTPPSTAATPAVDGRIGTLLGALDGDGNGSITGQEFTEAASALLRRPAPPQARDEGRGRRGLPGLERRLEKAFDRIDGNGDGNVDASELATALGVAPVGDENEAAEPAPAPAQPAPVPAPTPAAGVALPAPAPVPHEPEPAAPSSSFTASWYSVTYVSVAVQRYTSLQQAGPDASA